MLGNSTTTKGTKSWALVAATRASIETLGSTVAVRRATSISRTRVRGSVLTVLERDRLEGRVLLVAP
ncbi:unnamed protein product [Penicillium roqueforti FM164]|uniref:Uncharacterized protein n=1 Tax=Penicillium roqueforti (strain FM164) TaxID=1365484 RepID=W6QML8_PENRF|nr:unnamed protein product [Penicillium roqueforti FM164]